MTLKNIRSIIFREKGGRFKKIVIASHFKTSGLGGLLLIKEIYRIGTVSTPTLTVPLWNFRAMSVLSKIWMSVFLIWRISGFSWKRKIWANWKRSILSQNRSYTRRMNSALLGQDNWSFSLRIRLKRRKTMTSMTLNLTKCLNPTILVPQGC